MAASVTPRKVLAAVLAKEEILAAFLVKEEIHAAAKRAAVRAADTTPTLRDPAAITRVVGKAAVTLPATPKTVVASRAVETPTVRKKGQPPVTHVKTTKIRRRTGAEGAAAGAAHTNRNEPTHSGAQAQLREPPPPIAMNRLIPALRVPRLGLQLPIGISRPTQVLKVPLLGPPSRTEISRPIPAPRVLQQVLRSPIGMRLPIRAPRALPPAPPLPIGTRRRTQVLREQSRGMRPALVPRADTKGDPWDCRQTPAMEWPRGRLPEPPRRTIEPFRSMAVCSLPRVLPFEVLTPASAHSIKGGTALIQVLGPRPAGQRLGRGVRPHLQLSYPHWVGPTMCSP